MAATTNYTTYDQAYYYADLDRIPRYPREERLHYIKRMQTGTPAEAAQARERLIESFLPLAAHFVRERCPQSLAHRCLPDLIQAANLVVVEAINRVDPHRFQDDDMSSYIITLICCSLKSALACENLIHVPYHARARAKAAGTLDTLSQSTQVVSLEEQMRWAEDDPGEEPILYPLATPSTTSAGDPQRSEQIKEWLSYLSPHAQAILQFRYGLAEGNERCHTHTEIAHLLGTTPGSVAMTERDALQRLRALASGKATIRKQRGKSCLSLPQVHPYGLTPEREQRLWQAATHLQVQGMNVTGRRLAQETGLPAGVVWCFLQQHRERFPKHARIRQSYERLEQAYTRLVAQGQPVTVIALERLAHVHHRTIKGFLAHKRAEAQQQAA